MPCAAPDPRRPPMRPMMGPLHRSVSEPFFHMFELAYGAGLAGIVILADALSRPRAATGAGLRSAAGTGVMVAAWALAFGAALVVTGAALTSAALVAALAGLLALVSNIKHKVLGEPLVFSDFALVGAVFQHPHFYLSALRGWQIAVIVGGAAMLLALLVRFSAAALMPRAAGVVLAAGAALALTGMLRRAAWHEVRARPDVHRDVAAHGLLACLLVHWTGWRVQGDPPACAAPRITAEGDPIVIIVQCESFTDPADLFGPDVCAMPGLAEARVLARHAGRLMAPGFGAYTMRTEYGVLFGRSEDELGLRKFDPFLTAHREASFSLANRLCDQTWASYFVHPHDLRFYGRDRLMVAAGFGALVGEAAFAPPPPGAGRYVSDAAVAEAIIDVARNAPSAALIYAVTIENHGPWPVAKEGSASPADAPYLKLVRNSDAMLARLIAFAREHHRPVTLCFFGDHRPSIPAVSEPGPERHTPYVVVSFDADGSVVGGDGTEADLTPAQLHHLLLEVIAHSASSRVGQA